ncbi:unnamed protein product [Phytophthora lilii]|uniref:Unnamed protein product n=1 Tax=Phytophthora lilii TaxID=2077276 RepID=A0A9W7CY97_9STRA|nr:unnamed protein product [Phytophthora lilii]
MQPHHRKSHHHLAPAIGIRLTNSEGDQASELTEQVDLRRMSLDQASEHGVANLSELLSTTDSSYCAPPSRRTSIKAQVQPITLGALPRKTSLRSKVSESRALRRVRSSIRVVYFKESFYEVYGTLGHVMLLAFTLSFLAMLYMTVVQIIPNWTANFLMGTDSLDNGEFLLMSKPSQTIVVTSALMLSVFACLYLWLIVFMLSYNSETTVNTLAQAPDPKSLSNRVMQKLLPLMKRIQAQTGGAPSGAASPVTNMSSRLRSFENIKTLSSKFNRTSSFGSRTSSFGSNTANRIISDFTSMQGTYHHYYVRTLLASARSSPNCTLTM